MNTLAFLEFKAVSKIYKDNQNESVHAVNKANFSIEKGELVVFVGPSGCGKSTFLRMIAGLEEISEGDIVLDGKVINDLEVSKREIAMVFQDYALYPHMTVDENLSFGLENQKVSQQLIKEKILSASNLLEISLLRERIPKQLSGGQRQRVALGRALVKEPKVFLLDEPLSNLDAKLRVHTRKMIANLHKSLRATMIYVTHDQIEAMTLGDKIVVMRDGYIQQIGAPEEIYLNPKNTFVASFMGTPPMNLLAITLHDNQTIHLGNWEIKIPDDKKDFLADYLGKEVILGVRPEDIDINQTEGTLGMKAHLIEFLGSENLLYFNLDEGELIVKQTSSSKLADESLYTIDINPESIRLFNVDSELRIF